MVEIVSPTPGAHYPSSLSSPVFPLAERDSNMFTDSKYPRVIVH